MAKNKKEVEKSEKEQQEQSEPRREQKGVLPEGIDFKKFLGCDGKSFRYKHSFYTITDIGDNLIRNGVRPYG